MSMMKKFCILLLTVLIIAAYAAPALAAGELDALIAEVEVLPTFAPESDQVRLSKALWDLFLASPEDFAAAMANYEQKDFYRTSGLMITALRMTENREKEIAAAVRSLDLLSMNDVQQRYLFYIVYETEAKADLMVTDISSYDYPMLFGKMRYMDGGIVPLYDTHIQTVFTLDPAAYIAALSKEPEADWDGLTMRTVYAYEYEEDFAAFRETLSELSKEEYPKAEQEVIALLQKHCEGRTSLLPGSNPDMPPKTADAFDGIAAALAMSLSALACVLLIRKKKYA